MYGPSDDANTSATVDELDAVSSFRDTLKGCLSCLEMRIGCKAPDPEHVKNSAEAMMYSFMEAAKRLETEFNKHQLVWTVYRPDLALKEEIDRLKAEIKRKDEAIQRYKTHIAKWNVQLQQMGAGGPPTTPGFVPVGRLTPGTTVHLNQPGQGHGQFQ